MDKLVILDYSNGNVHIYNASSGIEIDDEYIECLGFNSNNCEWIVGNLDIQFHKGVLLDVQD